MLPGMALEKLMTTLAPIALGALQKKMGDYISTPHGSKVKEGVFKDCPIELIDNEACIVTDADKGEVLYLNRYTIESYEYKKKKKKIKGTYYYCNITFKDGSVSYVRMREKYLGAMLRDMSEAVRK